MLAGGRGDGRDAVGRSFVSLVGSLFLPEADCFGGVSTLDEGVDFELENFWLFARDLAAAFVGSGGFLSLPGLPPGIGGGIADDGSAFMGGGGVPFDDVLT